MPTKSRCAAQTLVITGNLALLTIQEQAEFIDSLNEDESPTSATGGNDTNLGYSD
jgi:hypothetical protein